MRKLIWAFIIFLFTVIALLALTLLVKGFAAGVNNTVIIPVVTAFVAFTVVVVANPIWQSWGYHITFFLGGLTLLILYLFFKPWITTKQIPKPLTTLQGKLSGSTPVSIPNKTTAKTVATKTITPEEPKAETVAATEEAKT